MDSEKPKPDPPPDRSPEKDSARRRVDRLTGSGGRGRAAGTPDSDPAGRPGERSGGDTPARASAGDEGRPAAAGDGRKQDRPPRLTERQRREAREKRRQERGSRRSARRTGAAGSRAGGPSGNALSRGVRATLLELRRTAGFARGLLLTALDRLGPAVRSVTAGIVAVLAAVRRASARATRALAAAVSGTGSLLLALERVLTPRRALIAVAGAGAVALVVSQFTDFRATEIGPGGYDPIIDIARAPRTDVLTPADSHSVLLLLAAAAAVGGLGGLALTGRRVFAAPVALAGLLAVAVTLLIDLPKGLDVGEAEIAYSEVAAILLSGFWIQLGAGVVLSVGGLALLVTAGAKRQAAESREAGARRGRGAAGRRPSSAGAGGIG